MYESIESQRSIVRSLIESTPAKKIMEWGTSDDEDFMRSYGIDPKNVKDPGTGEKAPPKEPEEKGSEEEPKKVADWEMDIQGGPISEKTPSIGSDKPRPGSTDRSNLDVRVAKPIVPAKKPQSEPEHPEPQDKPSVTEGAGGDEAEMRKEDIKHNPSHSLWTAPKGFYQQPAKEIARTLLKVSKNQKQAMARLMFYLNRSGKTAEIPPADMKRLQQAKEMIVAAGAAKKEKEA